MIKSVFGKNNNSVIVIIVVIVVNVYVHVLKCFVLLLSLFFFGKLKTRVPVETFRGGARTNYKLNHYKKKLHCFCDSNPGHTGRRQVLNHHTTIPPKKWYHQPWYKHYMNSTASAHGILLVKSQDYLSSLADL